VLVTEGEIAAVIIFTDRVLGPLAHLVIGSMHELPDRAYHYYSGGEHAYAKAGKPVALAFLAGLLTVILVIGLEVALP
jgi:hypothetical protein